MERGFRVGRSYGAALFGVEALVVEVQAARALGQPRAVIVGQAEPEVREGRERLKIALQGAGLWDGSGEQAIIINLAPADIPKVGTGLDLPMCLAVAALHNESVQSGLPGVLAYAEVGLDGELRPAKGTLSVAMAARAGGFHAILVPPDAAREAAEVGAIEVLAVRNLAAAVDVVRGRRGVLAPWPPPAPRRPSDDCDLSEVKGQLAARRALEVAATGGHNLLLIGPPGAGKTLLARRLATILPPMTRDEALEVTRVHSAAGLVPAGAGLVDERPFRAPHHSVSTAGLIGGGSPPRPGEISLAAHGVLFLDELPEFPRGILESLRQPLEDGRVSVVRVMGRALFPARFLLAGAMNPCPCGWRGCDVRECQCGPRMVNRYQGRISGPLLDRIDIQIEVPMVKATDLASAAPGESSTAVRERVVAARRIQEQRNERFGVTWNAHLRPRDLPAACPLSDRGRQTLDRAMRALALSARAHDRILKVARTLADLAAVETLDSTQIAEAVSYRSLDRASQAD